MNTRFLRRLLGYLCALSLTLPSHPSLAAHSELSVRLNGQPLSADVEAFIEEGTAYVSLSAFARANGPCSVTWDGAAAQVTTSELTISAIPGTQWVEANGRCLYVPGRVRLVDGRTMVPVRTLAAIYGAQVSWDAETATVSVSGGGAILEDGSTYYNSDTLYWLSRVISAESRGEPLTGQIAVGNVALNRVAHHAFPNSLYAVIFQPGQFEPVANGTIYDTPYHLSVTAAKLCLEGAGVIGDCLYFFAPDLSPGTWIVNNRTYYTTIGCHRFYL